MLVHKAKFASLLCATLVLQGCVTARYTTENGTRVTPDVIQSYVNGDNVTPFFPYRTEHFDSKLEMLDRQRAMYNVTPTDELNQQVLSHWYTDNASEIAAIRFDPAVKSDAGAGTFLRVFVNALASAFTLYILPIYASTNVTGDLTLVMEDGTEIKHEAKVRNTIIVTSLPFIFGLDHRITRTAMYEAQVAALISQSEKLRETIAHEQLVLQGLNRQSVDELTAALRNPNVVFLKPDIMASLGQVLATRRDRMDHYQKLVKEFPAFRHYIPGQERLFFVGPADRQVVDIWRELRTGADPDIVAANIRVAGKPYRLYNNDEVAWLKKQSIPGTVIAAMIDASAALAVAAPAAPVSATAPAVQHTNVLSAASSTGAATPEKNNLAEECVKAIAAIKACEQIPGDPFGIARGVCVKQVKKGLGATTCLGI